MQENNDKNQGKNGLSFESLDILIAKWKDGTFSAAHRMERIRC